MPIRSDRNSLRLLLVTLWLALTLSLAAWWMIHGLGQVGRLASMSHESGPELAGQQRMLLWEGSSFLLLLICGGGALFYFHTREINRNLQMKEFFATFTHELKTPLASLRLQAESLQEDISQSPASALVQRLVSDTIRLELSLENALFLASIDGSELLHLEEVSLNRCIARIQPYVTDMKILVPAECRIQADQRALEGILKNLIQNSRIHGKAHEIRISADQNGRFVRLLIQDDGQGFRGSVSNLGRLFHRHTPQSGSGIGLHLCRRLIERMGGELSFESGPPQGFAVRLALPGRLG